MKVSRCHLMSVPGLAVSPSAPGPTSGLNQFANACYWLSRYGVADGAIVKASCLRPEGTPEPPSLPAPAPASGTSLAAVLPWSSILHLVVGQHPAVMLHRCSRARVSQLHDLLAADPLEVHAYGHAQSNSQAPPTATGLSAACAEAGPDLEAGQPDEAAVELVPAEVKAEVEDTGLEGEESVIDAHPSQPEPTSAELVKAEAEGEAAAHQLAEHNDLMPHEPEPKPEQEHAVEAVAGLRDAVQREVLAEGEAGVKRALIESAAEGPAKRVKSEHEGPEEAS